MRVRDIGEAVDAPENTQLAAWADNKPAILLARFKLPGANVIETADQIKRAASTLRVLAPRALHISLLSDRTTTIQASVGDVQFTMLLTIILVVTVIFVFLRSFWATVIPSITVPLALLGTLPLMYALGFSLDNLSLMGLSIAVGFVVDDAIVMIGNVDRPPQDGKDGCAGGPRWRVRDRLHHRLGSASRWSPCSFQLTLDGEDRRTLLREFAITVAMTILISALDVPTITP